MDDKGVEKVIQYVSHVLSATQRRWATIEREAYAVVYSIKKLRHYLYGSQFTVLTDHKPLNSLFTKEITNCRIQRWAVLLAEYGARIVYRAGKHNVRADMLSRLHNEAEHQHDIAVIDTEEWVDPLAIMDDDVADTLPLIHDGLNLTEIAQEQQIEFNDLWKLGEDDENDDYEIIRGVLYSTRPPRHTAPLYPRLVLPAKYRTAIITRSHADVGHMGMFKTLNRVAEAYVWPGMQSSIRRCLRMCPTCTIHSRRTERVAMGNMPLANYPMQIIGADLIGPLPE